MLKFLKLKCTKSILQFFSDYHEDSAAHNLQEVIEKECGSCDKNANCKCHLVSGKNRCYCHLGYYGTLDTCKSN